MDQTLKIVLSGAVMIASVVVLLKGVREKRSLITLLGAVLAVASVLMIYL